MLFGAPELQPRMRPGVVDVAARFHRTVPVGPHRRQMHVDEMATDGAQSLRHSCRADSPDGQARAVERCRAKHRYRLVADANRERVAA